MSDINTATMLQVGTVLHGTYRIESYLSSGGFGNTYVAKNIEFDETYAIKEFFVKGVCQRDGNSTTISVSNSENTDSFAQQKEKFKKEARRLRSLSNPHIVKVYDLFEENGTAYYVMDYVDGENLSTRLNRTHSPLSESEVRNYLSQILDGLEAIHSAGIWHLDIKPANIMVDKHNVVKLIDFGASKQQSTTGGATASTGISYTIGYAPSEQMAQSFDKFGPWTDFYALGATLYKLLTNQNPPSVTDLSEDESEDKHIALPMPNVSDEMKKLVVWMMQVNRLKRPSNVWKVRDFMNLSLSNSVREIEDTIRMSSDNIIDNVSKKSVELEKELDSIKRKCEDKGGKVFSSWMILFAVLGILGFIYEHGYFILQGGSFWGLILYCLFYFFIYVGGACIAGVSLVWSVVCYSKCCWKNRMIKKQLSLSTIRMREIKEKLNWARAFMIIKFFVYSITLYLCFAYNGFGISALSNIGNTDDGSWNIFTWLMRLCFASGIAYCFIALLKMFFNRDESGEQTY